MAKLQITPEIKINELLENYPELEEKLIEIAPPFKKLKNEVLRKTLGKVTTLRQASKVGGVSLADLINKLRAAAGQNEITIKENKYNKEEKPDWVKAGNVKITYDARIDLENGLHPAGRVTKEILTLRENEMYLLITPFTPQPLIDIVKEKNFKAYTEIKSENEVFTFIKPNQD
ncbi:MAG: hypothetical protein CR986_08245 [Ignavibacteriae bacterium]|nr:MAG: hypothetical protein CR986_08245 [Ignavibacteriota bacterium]